MVVLVSLSSEDWSKQMGILYKNLKLAILVIFVGSIKALDSVLK